MLIKIRQIFCIFTLLIVYSSASLAAELNTPSANDSIEVTSWKALRDFRVVKQELDYSCGASSTLRMV